MSQSDSASQLNTAGKKFYLTEMGLKKIKEEHQNLLDFRISKSKGEAPSIFHSEELNPEYLAFAEDMELLDSRIADLEYITKNAEIITAPAAKEKKFVGLGAKVAIEFDGQKDEFEIVGTLEANPLLGKISNESPVGRALLGHRVGDEIVVSSPIKTIYKIKKIKYS